MATPVVVVDVVAEGDDDDCDFGCDCGQTAGLSFASLVLPLPRLLLASNE
jgi:hypothetical protein